MWAALFESCGIVTQLEPALIVLVHMKGIAFKACVKKDNQSMQKIKWGSQFLRNTIVMI